MFALLCAMSVGAAIVIARPSEDGELSTVTNEPAKIDDKDACALLQRLRLQAKDFALKTIEFGKELGFKTANATVYISDRIGDTITSLMK